MVPYLYVVRVLMDPAAVRDLGAWYKTRHAGDLIETGFLSVHHHRVVSGATQVCNAYEIHNVDVFGEAYERSADADDHLTGLIKKVALPGSTQTIYEQLVIIGGGGQIVGVDDGPSLRLTLRAPVVESAIFGGDDDDAIVGWFSEAMFASLRPADGWVASRIGRVAERQHPQPNNEVERRRWIVLTEWANLHAAERFAEVSGVPFPSGASDIERELCVKDLALLNPRAWRP
jgi:hypothetical protein